MGAISERKLPIKDGYVEREGPDGSRYYCPLPGETRLLNIEFSSTLHDAQIKAMDDRGDFLEECLVEMANILYAE